MAKQGISTGTSPNDGTGDSLLVGATKINLNFNEVYTTIGDGTTLAVPVTSVTAGTGINLSGSTGSVTITNTGIANTNNLRTDFLEVSGISTLSGGLAVTGNATATQFVGGGAGITGISTLNIVNYSGGGAGGSGVGTDNVRTNTLVVAGVSTLGITSTTNLTSQQLNVSGVSTFSGDINVNAHVSFKEGGGNSQLYMYDENAIYLGTNNDARLIYNNTGNIAKFERFGSAGEIEIDAAPVTLKHSDSTKLQTSSTGITVDGSVQVGAALNLQYSGNTSTILHNNLNGSFDIQSVSSINLKPGGSPVSIYSSDDILRFKSTTEGADLYGNINVGLATNVAGFTSTNSVNTPTLTLSHNNPTIAGTSGTTGNIKSIGGAPFYYDGTNWREFVLSTGTPVSQPEDSDWDNVIFRNDFDTSLTDQRLGQTTYSGSSGNVDLVASPVKVGTKSARIGFGGTGNGFALAYQKRDEYNFTGAWTIEGWWYLDTLPTGTGTGSVPLVAHTYVETKTWGLNVELSGGNLYFRWLNNSSPTHSAVATSSRGTQISQAFSISLLSNAWAHIALVRKASNGSLHLFINGTETTYTSSDQVIDNDIPAFENSYELWFGKCKITATTIYMDGNIDDIRISTSERYTSNFNPPTTALPISGTGSTSYTPPGSKQGEISLGGSPTWTGTTGVTASQIAAGQYRATFASAYSNATDYVIQTSMNDYTPATTPVGIGVSRFTTHADFFVTRVSDGANIDTGSLAIDLFKK